MHLPLFLVDSHIQDFIEVRDPLENSSFDDVKHDRILEFDCEVVPVSLLFSAPSSVIPYYVTTV